MKKRHVFTAFCATVAMALGTIGFAATPTQAANYDTIYYAEQIDNLTPDAPAPTNITFAAATVEVADADPAKGVSEGEPGGLSAVGTSLSPDPADGFLYYGQLRANPGQFSHPGIYNYKVTEPQTSFDGISGVNNPAEYYYILVHVEDQGGTNVVSGLTVVDPNGTAKVAGGDQANPLIFECDYVTTTVVVSKTTTGISANKTFDFTFTPSVTQAATKNGNGTYKIVGNSSTINGMNQFQLHNGQSVTIYGLTAGDVFKVQEDNGVSNGYEVSYVVDGGASAQGQTSTDITAGTTPHTVAFTNTRNINVPTGIFKDITPFIVIIGLGALFALVFFRRKSEE